MKHRYDHSLYIAAAGLLFPAWNQGCRLIMSGLSGFVNLGVELKLRSNRFNNPVRGGVIGYFASGSTSFYF